MFKIYKVIILFAFLCSSQFSLAAQVIEFSPTAPLTIPLTLEKSDYVTGNITTEVPIKAAVLRDNDNNIIRELDTKTSEVRLYIQAEYTGSFNILVTTEQPNSATVDINSTISQPAEHIAKPKLSPTIEKLKQHLITGGNTTAFWQKMRKQGTPLIEYIGEKQAIVTFLSNRGEYNVQLYGAPFGSHQNLERLAQSDVWFKSYQLPSDTVMSYQIAPNVPIVPGDERASRIAIVATKQKDPFNNYPWLLTSSDNYSVQSTIKLKDFSSEITLPNTLINENSLSTHTLSSKLLNNSRQVRIYKHPQATANSPVAIFFDGEAYLTKVPSVYIIEQLVTLGKIPPINAVFIDNASRSSRGTELPPNKAFATFMAKELMPWLNTMGIKPAPIDTILTGSSYGGLASTYVAFTYPNTFKKVLSQSGSFWWSPRRGSTEDKEPQWLTREIARADKADIHLYFNAGLFETGYFTIDILESNRHLRDVLTAKGYVYTYHEFSGGHDYYAWRYELARGLIKLLNNQ